MKNKNLIIGGLVLVGLAGAYYLYNKNKGGVVASNAPASASSPTMRIIPKPYDNTANCEEQFKKYMSRVRLKSMTPEESKAYKENWIKNNCSFE